MSWRGNQARQASKKLHWLQDDMRFVPTGILDLVGHPAISRHAQTLQADRVAKDVPTQVFAAHVVVGTHRHRRVQVPPVDVSAQSLATLAEARFVVVGQNASLLVDATELPNTQAGSSSSSASLPPTAARSTRPAAQAPVPSGPTSAAVAFYRSAMTHRPLGTMCRTASPHRCAMQQTTRARPPIAPPERCPAREQRCEHASSPSMAGRISRPV